MPDAYVRKRLNENAELISRLENRQIELEKELARLRRMITRISEIPITCSPLDLAQMRAEIENARDHINEMWSVLLAKED